MRGEVRHVPTVLFPVCIPEAVTAQSAVSCVMESLTMHRRYLCGAAEVARRNGGGGHLRVEVKGACGEPQLLEGRRWLAYLAEASWFREPVQSRVEALRRGPSQACFTVAVDLEHEGRTARCSFRMESKDKRLAGHLADCERLGADATTCVWMAMDCGEGGTALVVSAES